MSNKYSDFSINPISEEDIPYLKEYLHKALFIPPGTPPIPKSIIDENFIKPIYENWGKTGDTGFCAYDDVTKILIGMAWVRLYEKVNLPFGIIDPTIPTLTMAVDGNFRSKGIGTALIEKLIEAVKEQGFKGISLSVDHRNFAVKLYKKIGFKLYRASKEYNPLYLLKF